MLSTQHCTKEEKININNSDKFISESGFNPIKKKDFTQNGNQETNIIKDNDNFSDNDYNSYEGYEQLPDDDFEEFKLSPKPEPLQIKLEPVKMMSNEHVVKIKEVMNSIQIPEEFIPQWAKYIPESEWIPKVSYD
ncbi:hypothetical protein HDU92_007396 [Lobulomyces angularis]|nr:hypothetical protein HDU92_007396 [Lobulomyces angularis]